MNQPTPAIVAQSAVRRLPRFVLLLLGLIYVLAGFVGREPWKSADMSAFGYMAELASASGSGSWLNPRLLGLEPEVDALLPYWLGAAAIKIAPTWIPPEVATRLPFMVLLALTLLATWHAVYNLARSPLAQPVAFAFGGEADPADYARAMADGGLLALLATLGLTQLSHEITPALAQLSFGALLFYAASAMPYRVVGPTICAIIGIVGLALSGAPTIAVLLGAGITVISWTGGADEPQGRARRWSIAMALLTLMVAAVAGALDLWRWRIVLPPGDGRDWQSLGRLLLWFTWPAWPLALWALWSWRKQLIGGQPGRHLALPLWFAAVAVATTVSTSASDRSLLLALPALAALAAFALPTLRRSMAALIDWFTLLFFSVWAIVIWFMWIAMQTGVPPRPAANVARLLPGYDPQFQPHLFVMALAASL
ncbi:MAG: hypothetical protein ABI589_12115, partial [Burkholderiales bacterium]